MKLVHFPRRAAAAVLAAAVLAGAALPVFASDTSPLPEAASSAGTSQTGQAGEDAAPPGETAPDPEENTSPALTGPGKEEVVYGKLNADGTVQRLYTVNHFAGSAGRTVTDYGDYTAVRNMTTTDPIAYADGAVTLTPASDGDLYYEGTMDPAATPLPWLIEIHYILDGKEIAPADLAGRSGALIIRLNVSPNPDCQGDWFDQYALQTTVTLDTASASNIRAAGGTIASVGSQRQIIFTLLPGQTSEVEVAADVTNFSMPAITLNGIQLQLKLDIDGVALTNRLSQLTTGTGQLDEGAAALSAGIAALEQGLTLLTDQNDLLTGGSAAVNSALLQLQNALSGISASNDQLNLLLDASKQIGSGIDQLDDGVALLESQVNYDAFKNILAQNGLDLDTLAAGNAKAIAMLQALTGLPFGVGDQISQIVLLLQGNTALAGAMQLYLDTVSQGIGALRQGTSAVREGYAAFDSGIQAMAGVLNGMLQNMALLSDAVTTLATQYGVFDTGVNAYTQGVDQILAGTQQLSSASLLLVAGAHQLYTETSNMQLDEELGSLLDTLSAPGVPASFTSNKNTVSALQFALQTEPIQPDAAAAAEQAPAHELTFWEKLLDLFGLYDGE